ncbi:MAG: hypothetical protein HQ526_10550 [Actinobacteria bacterium]|nr:hypothetical protein [Actinomycetota bacterium]
MTPQLPPTGQTAVADTQLVEHAALPAEAFTDAREAGNEWAATATVISANNAMRQVSYTGTKATYRPRDQRVIPADLPRRPCAVMLFDNTARLHTLAFDLDAKTVPSERVRAESVELALLLRSCGLPTWIDESPSGGRHVYARLPYPIPALDVRGLARALRARFRTLDIAPLSNVGHGCIRPTGSPHTSGGYQRAVTPGTQLHYALTAEPSRDGWAQLKALVPPLPEPASVQTATPDQPVIDLRLPRIAAWAEQIATSGPPEGRYASESHARMAVAGAAARAGWTLNDYQRAVRHRWTWLRTGYAAKRRNPAAAAAYDFVKAESNAATYSHSARKSDTSHTSTRAGGNEESINRQVRRWITYSTTLGRHHPRGSYSPLKQAIVRAVGVFALLQNRRFVNAGVRGYAIQSAAGHDSVARILHELEEDGLLWRVSRGRSIEADVWALNLEAASSSRPWRGKVGGTRAVFRVLGGWHVAEVYEDLVAQRGNAQSSIDIARRLGRAKSSVDEALAVMASWDLARNIPRTGWVQGGADPAKVSTHLGADVLEVDQLTRYQEHRKQWRIYLDALPSQRIAEQRASQQAETLWEIETQALEDTELPDWLLHDPPARTESDVG